jgi:uncharacterized protein YpmS
MKNGNILLESLVFLVLSIFMVLLVFNGVKRLWNTQRMIEKNSAELALKISIFNVTRTGSDVPSKLKMYLEDYNSNEKNSSKIVQQRIAGDSALDSDGRLHGERGNSF